LHLRLKRYDRRQVDGCWMIDAQVQTVLDELRAHELRGARRKPVHRRGARRSRARRLRHSGGDPPRLSRASGCASPTAACAKGCWCELMRADDVWAASPARVVRRASAHGAAEDEEEPHRLAEALARAPAQRSLCGARQARRHALARRLQADRDRRQVPLLKPGARVVDLGAAPGGWSEIAAQRVGARGQGKVVAIDISRDGADRRASSFASWISSIRGARAALHEMLGGGADVVLSDMAANATGHKKTDQLKIMALVEAGAEFAREVLRPGGAFSPRCCRAAPSELLAELKRDFATVRHVKPQASRADSSELYLLATSFSRGRWLTAMRTALTRTVPRGKLKRGEAAMTVKFHLLDAYREISRAAAPADQARIAGRAGDDQFATSALTAPMFDRAPAVGHSRIRAHRTDGRKRAPDHYGRSGVAAPRRSRAGRPVARHARA
jgi:23S rRNA (uridine2552-2'-O)-methyltransferase